MELEGKQPERQPSPAAPPAKGANGNGTSGAAAAAAAPASATEPATTRSKAGRGYFVVLAVAGAMVAGIGGYVLLTAGEEATDDAQVSADVVPVGTRVAGRL